MGGEAFGETLAAEGVVAGVGDHAAGGLETGEKPAAAEDIVADHVLALAEFGVEELEGFGG